jgi:hypothetical protein
MIAAARVGERRVLDGMAWISRYFADTIYHFLRKSRREK